MRSKQRFRGWCTLVTSGLLTLGLAGQAWTKPNTIISALNMVPADAPIAMVVPSLSGLSDKVANLNEQSLGSRVPHLNDLLGSLKRTTGFTDGLDDDGSLIFIVTDAQALNHMGPDPQDPPIIILAPVSDYGVFVDRLGGSADDTVTRIDMAALGTTGAFAKKLDNYAVIGSTQEQVTAFQPGQSARRLILQAGKVGSRCLSTSDAVILLNIEAIEPVVKPKLQAALDQMDQQFDQLSGAQGPMKRLVKAIGSIYGDSTMALLRDTSSVVVGVDLKPQGVGLSYTAQFKQGSHLAQIFTTGTGAAGQLSALRKQDYWLASALNFSGIDVQTLTRNLTARFPSEENDPLSDLVRLTTSLIQQTKGMAAVYMLPDQPPMMGSSFIKGVVVYETTDPKMYTRSIQDYFEATQKFLNLVNQSPMVNPIGPNGQPDLNAPPLQTQITMAYVPNVLQVDSTAVDEYRIQYQLPPQVTQQMGPTAPMVMMMMGGTGQSGYIAARGSHVVMTTTRDPQLIKETLAAIGQPNGLGTSGPIAQARQAGLPPNTVLESYLNIPGIIKGVNMFIAMMGQPPIEVPQDLQPIAMATSVENHGLMGRLYVPTDVIRFCKDAVDQATRKFGGGDAHRDETPNGPSGRPDDIRHGQGPPPAPF